MIRDVGFLSWKQPSAWMEEMSGKRWTSMVKKENDLFMKAVKSVCSEEELYSKSEEFSKANGTMYFSYNNIIIKLESSYEYIWHYNDSKETHCVTDLCVDGSYVYNIKEVGHGAQDYKVECINDEKILWSKSHVGSQVYVYNNICYVLGLSNKLWYNSLIALDSKSGKVLKTLYEENDPKYNLRIVKGENALFLIREKSGTNNFFLVKGLAVHFVESTASLFYPIGYYKDKLCYLENTNNIWSAIGFKLKDNFTNCIEYFSLQHGIYVLRDYGLKRVFNLKGKEIYSFYGNMIFHPFNYKKSVDKFYIDFSDSGLQEFTTKLINPCNTYCSVKREFCKSEDGTKVAYLVAKPYCDIKGLMVIGYGAYGIETSLSTRRWIPYLNDGWLLCFAMVRGSGDVDNNWIKSARVTEKAKSCEDFEACIKDVQTKYSITPRKTCIYGRSAGGYLVGMAVSRNPNGSLFKMVYTEVPYVDVLRTTSNPNLPLTILEYDEFGNPAKNIYEFEKILELSPVDSLLSEKPPDLNVILRTSENDIQVYPYESYKWLYALRGKNINDSRKLLYNSEKLGHFVKGIVGFTHFSEDFFLLKHTRDNASK